jgi:hypothetical protein
MGWKSCRLAEPKSVYKQTVVWYEISEKILHIAEKLIRLWNNSIRTLEYHIDCFC